MVNESFLRLLHGLFEPIILQQCEGQGGSLWMSSLLMAKMVQFDRLACLRNRNVLELGSGIGVGGFTAAKWGGANRVWLTDNDPNVLEVLHRTREINGCDNAQVQLLEWTAKERVLPLVDVIIGCDVIFSEIFKTPDLFAEPEEIGCFETAKHVANTIKLYLQEHGIAILISNTSRSPDECALFMSFAKDIGLEIQIENIPDEIKEEAIKFALLNITDCPFLELHDTYVLFKIKSTTQN